MSWWAGWSSGDLVWSLWLSSLVVGYANIVWVIGLPAASMARLAWKDPLSTPRDIVTLWALILIGVSVMLAFFTVHFGGFHYVHSQFLLHFFPIDAPRAAHAGWADKATYLEVYRRYWIFLPSAFLSHRSAFLGNPLTSDGARWTELFSAGGKKNRDYMGGPYKNVLRMHGLIFLFFLAHFAGLENFALYAVIYVVYFFPWRLVRGDSTAP